MSTGPTPPPTPSPTPSPMPAPSPVPKGNVIGCFKDKVNKQCDFEFMVTGQCGSDKIPKDKSMSWKVCNAKCLEAGYYKYFGLQNGGSGCFCGNSYGSMGENKTEG